MKHIFTIIFILVIITNGFTQKQNMAITQTLRGVVKDAVDDLPIEGATVFLMPSDVPRGVITNKNGTFRFDSIPLGRYQLKVSYVGYKTVVLSEILVESGKESIRNIILERGAEALNEVVVVAGRPKLNTLSVHTITTEQTQRYAATFYDPARLATAFAGVINQNDQANNLVVRGNSPTTTAWWLEGAEIVNPNHAANAGTFSDKVMPNGGGVNILSAQLLGDSYFFKGNHPTQYGNGLSGVLDMRLRKGNDEKREYTAQIGLIGIDVAAEGPFNKGSEASYLINYRYSTLGLLNEIGVQLGDEEISFQDLSFNLALPTNKVGTLTLFGVGGKSQNTFEAQRDTALWEFQKDKQDIYFKAKMGAIGLTYDVPFEDKALWKTTLVLSSKESNRLSFRLDDDFNRKTLNEDNRKETKLSLASILQINLSENIRLKTGLNATQYTSIARAGKYLSQDSILIIMEGNQKNWLYRPFANVQFRPTTQLKFNVGAGFSYYLANQTTAFEPLFSVDYDFNQNQSLTFSYRLQSQLQMPTVYYGANISSNTLSPNGSTKFGYNQNLEMSKSHQLGLGYRTNIFNQLNVESEIYYQSLFDIPIINNENSTYSVINLLDEIVQDTLKSLGTGKNYGIEVTVQKFMDEGYYALFSTSFYQSKYTAGDGIERNTRFNGNYAFVLSAGKEFYWTKRGINRIFGLNFKSVYIGGFRETPINETESFKSNETIYFQNQAFQNQLPNYFKTDLRIYFKRNKKKYTSTLALDIQNVTNQKNVAFNYYDTEKQEIITKYQLQIIPILVYRVEF